MHNRLREIRLDASTALPRSDRSVTARAIRDTAFRQVLDTASSGATASARYTVKPGDTLCAICDKAIRATGHVPVDGEAYGAASRVAAANGLSDPNRIQVGQQLDLSSITGALSRKLRPARVPVLIPVEETSPFAVLSTEKSTTVASRVGARATGGPVALDTRLERLMERVRVLREPESVAAKELAVSTGLIDGDVALSSSYGLRRDPFTGRWQRHNGVDLAASAGSAVFPAKAGSVVSSGWEGGYGRMVVIRHDDGLETRYAHLSKSLVKAGDTVEAGQPIAEVGSTGRSTGPHLHFEVRRNGRAIDPNPYIPEKTLRVASLAR